MGRGERTQPLGRRGWGRAGTAPATAGGLLAMGDVCPGGRRPKVLRLHVQSNRRDDVGHGKHPTDQARGDPGLRELRGALPGWPVVAGQFRALERLRDGSVGAGVSFVSMPLSSRIAHSMQLCIYSLRRAAMARFINATEVPYDPLHDNSLQRVSGSCARSGLSVVCGDPGRSNRL